MAGSHVGNGKPRVAGRAALLKSHKGRYVWPAVNEISTLFLRGMNPKQPNEKFYCAGEPELEQGRLIRASGDQHWGFVMCWGLFLS